MNNEIKLGQLYRHYKGNHYEVILIGKHSETGDELIGYRRREDGHVYFRPRSMFFEIVQVDGKSVQRFVRVYSRKDLLIQIFGWYGMMGLLIAYTLLSFNILTSTSIWYQAINITAAFGIVTISLYKKTYQPGILNIIWAIIGLTALIKILV
jgi:hypothetical protein